MYLEVEVARVLDKLTTTESLIPPLLLAMLYTPPSTAITNSAEITIICNFIFAAFTFLVYKQQCMVQYLLVIMPE